MNETLCWEKHRHIIIPVILFLALLSFSAAFLPPEAVWITDNGNKLMIMHNFLDNGTIYFDHASPENFPKGGFHFQTLDNGRTVSFHSPYLPVLTALLYRITGSFSTTLIPALSMTGIAVLLLLFPGRKRWQFFMLAATPLIFYSFLLWEMVPAALAVTLTAWCFFRKRFTLAGIFFGCGVWMREELYLLGFTLLIALTVKRQWRIILKFALGAIIPVLTLWITNFLLFGHIAGVHGSTYFINNRTEKLTLLLWGKEVLFNFYQHLVRFETLPGLWSWIAAAAGTVPLLCAGFAPGYTSWKKFKLIAGTLFALGTTILAIALWRHDDYLMICIYTAGLLLSVPVLAGFFLNFRALLRDRHGFVSLAAMTVLIYILSIAFLLNPNDPGLTWGARHFIIIMPLMLILGNYALVRAGFFKNFHAQNLLALCCIAGIIMQIYAISALIKVAGDAEFLQNEILSLPNDTLLSDIFFLPEMTPLIPSAKTQLEIANDRQFAAAMEYLQNTGTDSFILILSPDYRRMSNENLAILLNAYPPRMRPRPVIIGNSLRFLITVCSR
ncbi:MAG: hypothetical protein IKC94_05560 [Lentisphaeria bacterium]|nr:hypothetical protein [Lentisphaeria bacterium]